MPVEYRDDTENDKKVGAHNIVTAESEMGAK